MEIRDVENAKFFVASERAWFEEWQGESLELKFIELTKTPGESSKPDSHETSGDYGDAFSVKKHPIHLTWGVFSIDMSELKAKIRAELTASMKARDKDKTGTLRMLLSALMQEETAGTKHELSDEEVLKVIAREIKKRRESAEVYSENAREDLAEVERKEAAILETYQPRQLGDEELNELIDASIAEISEAHGGEVGMKNMGEVMKLASSKAAGRADGKRLSTAVKSRLS